MAAQGVSVTVSGTEEFAAGCETLIRRIDENADHRFRSVADQIATLVRSRVPVVSGRLRGSVEAGESVLGADVSMGGSEAPYAGWIEFGGVRSRPYLPGGRYLLPAARDAGPELKRAGEMACQEQIEMMTWHNPTPL